MLKYYHMSAEHGNVTSLNRIAVYYYDINDLESIY